MPTVAGSTARSARPWAASATTSTCSTGRRDAASSPPSPPPKFTDLTGKVTWKADEEASKKSPYRQEHLEFLQSIREGHPFQRGKQLAVSTLTTVLGQMAVYTGQQITWEEGLKSKFAFPPAGEIRLDMEPPVQAGPRRHLPGGDSRHHEADLKPLLGRTDVAREQSCHFRREPSSSAQRATP